VANDQYKAKRQEASIGISRVSSNSPCSECSTIFFKGRRVFASTGFILTICCSTRH
jgi:hypothetical protein